MFLVAETFVKCTACLSTLVVVGSSGTIQSPNYPNSYDNNLNCKWTIQVPSNKRVSVIFSDRFNVESSNDCEYDSVQFCDDDTCSERFCGSIPPRRIVSATNFLNVTFKSDSSVSGSGFSFHWTGVDRCSVATNLTRQNGTIKSAHYPDNYPGNLHCEWHVRVPENLVIAVTFNNTFYIRSSDSSSCTADLTIFDGSSNDAKEILMENCGDEPPGGFVSSSNELTIVFKTDADETNFASEMSFSGDWQQDGLGDQEGWGFSLSYDTSVLPCNGHEIQDGSSGSIELATVGGKYFSNRNCTWHIRAPENSFIQVWFDYFEIEEDPSCQYDTLTIYDGKTTSSPKIYDRICSIENIPQKGFNSTTNEIFLHFISDNAYEYSGFALNWSAVASCRKDEYLCQDNSCISLSKKCDGKGDCFDSSDEIGCAYSNLTCEERHTALEAPKPLAQSSARIVGGREAKKRSWPWMVYLFKGKRKHFFCGGTLIDRDLVLTAAHCINESWNIVVVIGAHSLKHGGKMIKISRIDVHPDYKDTLSGNDIALIHLAEKVRFQRTVLSICLPNPKHALIADEQCYVTGWGKTVGRKKSDVLRQVSLSIAKRSDCDSTYNRMSPGNGRPNGTFCAGNYLHGGRDSCQGDSGGALMCFKDGIWKQYGIVSLGPIECGRRMYLGVYTNVSYFQEWIQNQSSTDVHNTTSSVPSASKRIFHKGNKTDFGSLNRILVSNDDVKQVFIKIEPIVTVVGGRVKITCSSDGNPAPTFRVKPEHTVDESTNPFYISNVQKEHQGDYRCVAIPPGAISSKEYIYSNTEHLTINCTCDGQKHYNNCCKTGGVSTVQTPKTGEMSTGVLIAIVSVSIVILVGILVTYCFVKRKKNAPNDAEATESERERGLE